MTTPAPLLGWVPLAQGVGRRIRREMQRQRLTYVSLSAESGVAERTIRRIVAGENLGKDAVDKLSQTLGLSWEWPC